MKHVFIIRHGETNNNKIQRLQGRGVNASINKKGEQQAQAIAEALSDFPIQKVVTSSLIRTLETAAPLISQTDALVEEYFELDEMDFGVFEKAFFNDVKDQLHDLNLIWSSGKIDTPIEGGESPQQVFDRAGSKIVEVLKNSKEDCIAFVVHGRLIRILLSGFLRMGLKNMHLIKHENGAINHLIWNGEGFEVVELNKIDHLSAIEVELS